MPSLETVVRELKPSEYASGSAKYVVELRGHKVKFFFRPAEDGTHPRGPGRGLELIELFIDGHYVVTEGGAFRTGAAEKLTSNYIPWINAMKRLENKDEAKAQISARVAAVREELGELQQELARAERELQELDA